VLRGVLLVVLVLLIRRVHLLLNMHRQVCNRDVRRRVVEPAGIAVQTVTPMTTQLFGTCGTGRRGKRTSLVFERPRAQTRRVRIVVRPEREKIKKLNLIFVSKTKCKINRASARCKHKDKESGEHTYIHTTTDSDWRGGALQNTAQ
jgi:hypothetical protein